MIKFIKPPKLKQGDTIGVIAPSSSAALISKHNLALAEKKFESYGLSVKYSPHFLRKSRFSAETIKDRVKDFHGMFADSAIKAIIAVIGGYTSNQLLPLINFNLIKKNPKIFIGFSDITALQNAIFSKTGLITFSGPCFASFAQINPPFDFEEYYFRKILMDSESYIEVRPSSVWADDEWWKTPAKPRRLKPNKGWRIIRKGAGRGVILGGNLSTFTLLFGTPYLPDLKGKILFLEEDPCTNAGMIERMFVQVSQHRDFSSIKGMVVGRFGAKSGLSPEAEATLLKTITADLNIPVVSNVDFGHTNPTITFPIGGRCEIETHKNIIRLKY